MKHLLIAMLVAALAASGSFARAADTDCAASHLAATGSLQIKEATAPHGSGYIGTGSYRDGVALALGTPSAVAPDGTYFYRDFSIPGSAAKGTLLVRFAGSQVSSLALISKSVELAMKDFTRSAAPLVASTQH